MKNNSNSVKIKERIYINKLFKNYNKYFISIFN